MNGKKKKKKKNPVLIFLLVTTRDYTCDMTRARCVSMICPSKLIANLNSILTVINLFFIGVSYQSCLIQLIDLSIFE